MKNSGKLLWIAGAFTMLLLSNCGPKNPDNDGMSGDSGANTGEYSNGNVDNPSDDTDGTGSSMGTNYDDEMNNGTTVPDTSNTKPY